ncbi:hypothetical protein SAMN02745126_04016 [Enhydrobacter aerosaccus]|uniref:Uncharacterized protein n=1 Tax=Enhydrobacter aerosaccus TaxID=225324 RepID=A0A1T4RPX0_9HYPH|nr:hypothetical protein [Enhydrobacter aerosaccus]SKA18003.1 hypothetical protein SAMN02745126_04016 [Enhydrobacter aerosaccus]
MMHLEAIIERNKGEPETVEITKAEYERLLRSRKRLRCLEAAGVFNWEGYGEAIQLEDEEG